MHHAIFVLVTAYVLHNSIYKFPFTWLSLCEASTPFVNYRRGALVCCVVMQCQTPPGHHHVGESWAVAIVGHPRHIKRCHRRTHGCGQRFAGAVDHQWMRFSTVLRLKDHERRGRARRWHLAVQGKKEGRVYVLNGAALCASFFLIRIVAYGAGLAHLWTLRRYWTGPGIPVLRRRVAKALQRRPAPGCAHAAGACCPTAASASMQAPMTAALRQL